MKISSYQHITSPFLQKLLPVPGFLFVGTSEKYLASLEKKRKKEEGPCLFPFLGIFFHCMFAFAFSLILTDYNHCDGQSSPGFLVAFGSTRCRGLVSHQRPVHRLKLRWQTRTVCAAGAMFNNGGTNFQRGLWAAPPGKF